MKRTQIQPGLAHIPAIFHPYFQDARVFDSSCSEGARVYFLDKADGFYLKCAPAGTLAKEAEMAGFFHKKGLGAEVLAYECLEKDWLLTRRLPGEDCTDPHFLSDPKRLCDTTATLLRQLHSTDPSGCPIRRTADYLENAWRNFQAGTYDTTHFPHNWGYATPEEAWSEVQKNGAALRCDTLLHGDYCLPNILLLDWQFSGFIDLDSAGLGDRHIDLFWGIWSLQFNLKTDAFRDRFLDAYGRDAVNEDAFRTIAACEVFG